MDLSLLQGPAATPPPATLPVSSRPVADGAEESTFDALLDEAVVDDGDDADATAPPVFVVAPVKEPWLDLVIRVPLDIQAPAPGVEPADAPEPAGDAIIAPAGKGGAVIDEWPIGQRTDDAGRAVRASADAPDAPMPPTVQADPAFAAALASLPAASASKAPSTPQAPATPDVPTTSVDRPAAPPIADAAPGDRVAPTSQPRTAADVRTGQATRASSPDRRVAEQELQQMLAGAPQTAAPSAAASATAGTSAVGGEGAGVVAPPTITKPENRPAARADAPPSAATMRMAVEAFARNEAQSEGSFTRGGTEHSLTEPQTTARGSVGNPSTAPVFATSAFAAMVDAPMTAEASAVADAAPAESSADLPDLLPQFVKGIQMQWRGTLGEARLELQPAHLGPVTVDLQVGPEGVEATLSAESPLVRGWIEAHEGDLREGLAGQGLHLASLTVTADPQEQRRRQAPRDAQANPDRRNADPPPENWQEAMEHQQLEG